MVKGQIITTWQQWIAIVKRRGFDSHLFVVDLSVLALFVSPLFAA